DHDAARRAQGDEVAAVVRLCQPPADEADVVLRRHLGGGHVGQAPGGPEGLQQVPPPGPVRGVGVGGHAFISSVDGTPDDSEPRTASKLSTPRITQVHLVFWKFRCSPAAETYTPAGRPSAQG